jgi:hypothetical protein
MTSSSNEDHAWLRDNAFIFSQLDVLTYFPQPCVVEILRSCPWLLQFVASGFGGSETEKVEQSMDDTLWFNILCFRHARCMTQKLWSSDLECLLSPGGPARKDIPDDAVGRECLWLWYDEERRSLVPGRLLEEKSEVGSGDGFSGSSTARISISGFQDRLFGVKALVFAGHGRAEGGSQRVVIALRPSYNGQNWRENLFSIPIKPKGLRTSDGDAMSDSWSESLRGCVVHAGFAETIYGSGVCRWLHQELARVTAKAKRPPRVYMTGISLGGVLAFLLNQFVRQQLRALVSAETSAHTPEMVLFTFGAPQAGDRRANLRLMSGEVVRFQFQSRKDRLARLPGFPPFTHHQGSTYSFDMSAEPPQLWDWARQAQERPLFIKTLKHNMHHCCYAGTWFRYPLRKHDWPFWKQYLLADEEYLAACQCLLDRRQTITKATHASVEM